MDEARKRFWDTFEQMQEDIDRFMDHFARVKRPSMVAYRAHWSPPCNVYDADDSIHVLVEIAGMRREALDVRIETDRLILRGHRQDPCPPSRCQYRQVEIEFGEFELEMPLDTPVDAEAAQAWYAEGFLHIKLPKIPEPKPQRITLSVPDRP